MIGPLGWTCGAGKRSRGVSIGLRDYARRWSTLRCTRDVGHELARYRFDSDLTFGMTVPIHYATDEPFRLSSARDIRWTVPKIDVYQLAHQIGDRVHNYVS